MTRKGVLVCEMPDNVYRTNIGAIRKQISRHVRIDIERTIGENGDKMVEIWCQHPGVVRSAVEKVLVRRYEDASQEEM